MAMVLKLGSRVWCSVFRVGKENFKYSSTAKAVFAGWNCVFSKFQLIQVTYLIQFGLHCVFSAMRKAWDFSTQGYGSLDLFIMAVCITARPAFHWAQLGLHECCCIDLYL